MVRFLVGEWQRRRRLAAGLAEARQRRALALQLAEQRLEVGVGFLQLGLVAGEPLVALGDAILRVRDRARVAVAPGLDQAVDAVRVDADLRVQARGDAVRRVG